MWFDVCTILLLHYFTIFKSQCNMYTKYNMQTTSCLIQFTNQKNELKTPFRVVLHCTDFEKLTMTLQNFFDSHIFKRKHNCSRVISRLTFETFFTSSISHVLERLVVSLDIQFYHYDRDSVSKNTIGLNLFWLDSP